MTIDDWLDFVAAILPTLLWVGLIGFVVWRFQDPIKEQLYRLSGFGFMGMRLDFIERATEEAVEKPGFQAPPGASDRLLRRLKASGDLLREATILWLDDHPVHNVVERRFLSRVGAWVETVRSTDEAKEALRWSRFDVVIADLRRDREDPNPQIAREAADLLHGARVIYYAGNFDPSRGIPEGAFGITNEPDKLYDLVIDAVERSRLGASLEAGSLVEEPSSGMSEKPDLDSLLEQLLGPGARFRPGQREAIEAVLAEGARVLLVQATGWGKSVVYWLASRVLRDQGRGPTLIISPLPALMRDQVRAATKLGLRAVTVNAANRDEWQTVLEALRQDEVDVLLISPERLGNDAFLRSFIPAIRGAMGLFVVDEVHCISDWGHDFRPDYRRIGAILAAMPPSVPVLGTTATANSRVRSDVADQLGPASTIILGSLARPSLRLGTLVLSDQAERLAWLAQWLPKLSGDGIVYCLTVADTERVAAWLSQRGIEARAYTGQMDTEQREELERALLAGEIKALVATVALGMGFDKPDLGWVVHFQRPGSVVAYYQQVGRAGRAMLDDAYGILLSGREDDEISEYFIESAFPPIVEMRSVLDELAGVDTASVSELTRRLNLRWGRIEAIVKLLEVDGAVVRVGGRYQRTLLPWEPDEHRIERISDLRHRELEEMRRYVLYHGCLMAFLLAALDDESVVACGQCMNCRRRLLDRQLDNELVQEAVRYLRRSIRPIPARLVWAASAVAGLSGRIAFPNEEGVALSIYGDAGWGAEVAHGKYTEGRFSDELTGAAAEPIRDRWNPSAADGWWVTAIPSHRHAGLVGDAARGIAERLGVPYRDDVLSIANAAPRQKEMENSVTQLRNVHASLGMREEPLPGPVILVDHIVDSRWMLTMAGHLLRTNGAGAVHPFAFAEASSRVDG